jgi:hypothetical protein
MMLYILEVYYLARIIYTVNNYKMPYMYSIPPFITFLSGLYKLGFSAISASFFIIR